EMEDSDITRATVQIRYRQFGEEKEANVHLSPSRGEPLMEERLFVDRGTRGVATRLIFNHKTEGKLVLDWVPVVGDNYLYAQIPEELLEEGSELREKAKEAGEKLVESAGEKVLDQFEALLEGEGR
ncbi:MAG: hypothetical protein MI919_37240, partial [Holophagales bacterium]|nr:hypothetical protein [Holophagales bacterium]